MINACENNKFIPSELESWRDILDLHSRIEDEIIVVALQARLKEKGASDKLPDELVNGDDHEGVKSSIAKCLECKEGTEQLKLLKELASELDEHLKREEETIMPLLLEHFTERELWAIDSFIVNEKLDYCDKETLIKITKW